MRVFSEEQRFTQTWLIVVMTMSTIVPFGIILNEFLKENSSMKTQEFILVLSILLIAIVPIFFFKLYTRIDENGIHYRFAPFHFSFKKILWAELDECYVRKYDALTEYGGWGFKGGALWKKSNGKAINVAGEFGIQLQFKNGKKLLIGTQKENEAKLIIEHYFHKV